MRWRFTDKITDFEAWKSIRGIKAVSLEEYSLLEWTGRKGSFPENLVVEACVHLSRWLVAASSQFRQSCLLKEIGPFAFTGNTNAGSALFIAIEAQAKADNELNVVCDVSGGDRPCGSGKLTLTLVSMRELICPKDMEALWRELYGKA